jgi:hypothetical protein
MLQIAGKFEILSDTEEGKTHGMTNHIRMYLTAQARHTEWNMERYRLKASSNRV